MSEIPAGVKSFVDQAISGSKVTAFSKTYCPYCHKAKAAIDSFKVGIPLPSTLLVYAMSFCVSAEAGCPELGGDRQAGRHGADPRLSQAADWCSVGPSSILITCIFCKMVCFGSVPRVFVQGKFIGGGDDCVAAKKNGSLEKMLSEAGAI